MVRFPATTRFHQRVQPAFLVASGKRPQRQWIVLGPTPFLVSIYQRFSISTGRYAVQVRRWLWREALPQWFERESALQAGLNKVVDNLKLKLLLLLRWRLC